MVPAAPPQASRELSARELSARELALGFQALADPLRLTILQKLFDSERCVCDLCEVTGIAQSKVSFHLKKLRSAGLIDARPDGRWMYYRLNRDRLAALEAYFAWYRQASPIVPAPPYPPGRSDKLDRFQ